MSICSSVQIVIDEENAINLLVRVVGEESRGVDPTYDECVKPHEGRVGVIKGIDIEYETEEYCVFMWVVQFVDGSTHPFWSEELERLTSSFVYSPKL